MNLRPLKFIGDHKTKVIPLKFPEYFFLVYVQTKVMVTDVPESASNLTRDPDRLERVSSTASGGLWAGPAKVNVR